MSISLVVWQLRLHISNAGAMGLIPSLGTKNPHAVLCGKKKKKIYEVLESVLVTSQAWVQTTALHRPFTSNKLVEVFLLCSLLLKNGMKINVSKQQKGCILTKSLRWNII